MSVRLGPPTPHGYCCDGAWRGGVQERGYTPPYGTYRCQCRCHPDGEQEVPDA